MKKSVLLLLVAGLFTAVPAFAAEHEKKDAQMSKECVQRCVLQTETLQQKIERLQSEIAQGKKTYSAAELQKLENKLNEANYMLDSLMKP